MSWREKSKNLSNRLQELESTAVADPSTVDTSSPDDRHTVRSIAASSPATREGASLSFIAHLFSDANWRKSHATLLRTLADAPGTDEVSIAPCSLPSAVETQMLFEKYLSWAHIQNPFLLRRSIWALHQRLFNGQGTHNQASSHDLFRVFMICAIGAVLPYRNKLHHRHPEAYYNAALQHLGSDFLTRGLDSVQDLLLICRFGIYHQIGTSIWDVVRLCGRLCIELGLHNGTDIRGDLLQTQLRRRIFWQFYLIDRYSSTTLDRPFLIDDADIETKFPVEVSDEELEVASRDVQSLDSLNFTTEAEDLEYQVKAPTGGPRSCRDDRCQKREMVTHTRSYFHMLFTAALSVMYCISVSKKLTQEDMRASHQGLLRCQELLNSVARQLPDAKSYVSVFEALHRDVSQRLWPNVRDVSVNLPVDPAMGFSNDISSFNGRSFSPDLGTSTLPNSLGNLPDFSTNRPFFDQGLQSRPGLIDPVSQFAVPGQDGNDISEEYQDGSSVNWALLNYDSLWNMESALGQYVYGDPTNPSVWDGFEF
ncbi:hypothetical protein H9Q72_013464 [Fusarium xylarioides]|uniref:Xylanolytic transcriptional activator regulatory domain-containing protein n=1 Tax=Fusarium xylarioides TaxID=221167 RepID=A0A9P7KZH9_9HYPO|nr:hypothetical protein H9Q72_013464 [Fusarium xylarioides]